MSKSKENACDYSGSNISAELFSAEPNILSSAASLVTSIISKDINWFILLINFQDMGIIDRAAFIILS